MSITRFETGKNQLPDPTRRLLILGGSAAIVGGLMLPEGALAATSVQQAEQEPFPKYLDSIVGWPEGGQDIGNNRVRIALPIRRGFSYVFDGGHFGFESVDPSTSARREFTAPEGSTLVLRMETHAHNGSEIILDVNRGGNWYGRFENGGNGILSYRRRAQFLDSQFKAIFDHKPGIRRGVWIDLEVFSEGRTSDMDFRVIDFGRRAMERERHLIGEMLAQ